MALIEITICRSLRSAIAAVLTNVDVTIEEGEFVCVLGQTGCGKSTLLRLILGSEQPSAGRILIDGREHNQPDRTRGYVPQKYSLFPDKTVLDNITFGPEVCEFGLLNRCTPRFFRRRREFRREAASITCSRIGLDRPTPPNIPTSSPEACSSAWPSRRR